MPDLIRWLAVLGIVAATTSSAGADQVRTDDDAYALLLPLAAKGSTPPCGVLTIRGQYGVTDVAVRTTLNERGYPLSRVYERVDGEDTFLTALTQYEYGEDDRLETETVETLRPERRYREVTYEYDHRGRQVRSNTWVDGQVWTSVAWLFEGDLLTRYLRATPGDSELTTYEYDSAGRLIREVHFDDADPPALIRIYLWEGTRLVRLLSYYPSLSGQDDETAFKYDTDGRLVLEEITLSDGDVWRRIEYVYDQRGRLVTETVDTVGSRLDAYTYAYDMLGRLVEMSFSGHYASSFWRASYSCPQRLREVHQCHHPVDCDLYAFRPDWRY